MSISLSKPSGLLLYMEMYNNDIKDTDSDIKLIKMTIMDIDISNSGLTSSVDFLEKYSALHLSNELYESNFDSDKKNRYVSDCYEYFGKNNCYGFDTGYSMSEPGYNSDEELEKIKGEVKSINHKIDSILHDGNIKRWI
jgi:hypothetical protein